MLGTQNHGLWNMGPRFRGDDDFGNSQKGLAGGARRGPVEGGNAQEGDGRTTTTTTTTTTPTTTTTTTTTTTIPDRSVTPLPYARAARPSVNQLTLKGGSVAAAARAQRQRRRSDLDLLVLDDAFDRGTLEHAILERRVVLELPHRQLAAHAPGVEHEAVRIDHGVLVAEPFPARELAVDLLQIAVEGFQPRLLERGESRRVGCVALGPTDMGMRGMHARREEADQRQRFGFRHRIGRPQPETLAQIGQNGGVLRQRLAVVELERGHAALRVDLEVRLGALLAAGEIDLLRLIFVATLFHHDVRSHRTRARRVVQRQHSGTSFCHTRSVVTLKRAWIIGGRHVQCQREHVRVPHAAQGVPSACERRTSTNAEET